MNVHRKVTQWNAFGYYAGYKGRCIITCMKRLVRKADVKTTELKFIFVLVGILLDEEKGNYQNR